MLLLALACGRQAPTTDEKPPGLVTPTPPVPEPTTPATLPSEPPPWTTGPPLPACTPAAGDPDRVALSGVVLLPAGPEAGWVVLDRATGTIACAGASCDVTGATVVCTDGVISPALIVPHDHGQYNVLGPWRHTGLYGDRYEWQSDGDYWDFREAYDAMADAYACECTKWAELRHVASGATTMVGSYGGDCIDGLARDLDDDLADGLAGYTLEYGSGQIWYLDDAEADARTADLASGTVDAYLEHVAEGIGGRVQDEVDYAFDIGAVGPGQVFVHATDATVEDLARMAAGGTGLVWSPRSNLDLYADTTMADVAVRLGVPLAIGPDWTWSGSNRETAELACAREWLGARGSPVTDAELWAKATLDAAVLLGLDGTLGMLVAGARADVAVFRWRDEPYRAVIEAAYEDVRLVTIDGDARYGVAELVAGLEPAGATCEEVLACAETRTFCVAEGTGTDAQGYADLEAALSSALAATPMPQGLEYAGELYPLWACDEVRESCDPRTFVPGDLDGDGVDDGLDACGNAYDPRQTDHDRDGVGDACDPCPLSPLATCAHDPADIDGDGLANGADGCPWVHDPGSPDADADGHPDACDPCPDAANPGTAGCPASIRTLRDPADPAHPPEGTRVTISGVVTGAGADGFFLQDPAAANLGALYVYGVTAAAGDAVSVTGTYVEYYGLTELEDAAVSVTGTAPVPAPIEVSDPCAVATGGADAERYESMLVRVGPVSVSDANPDDPGDYDEFEVGGCLRVDDLLCPDCWLDQPAAGTAYGAITGPLDWRYGNSKLQPRTPADLE